MKFSPVRHKDAEKALKKLGFTKLKQGSTSHEHWIKEFPGEKPAKRKVTLDKHNSPYCNPLLRQLINQTGVSKKEFYRAAGLIK